MKEDLIFRQVFTLHDGARVLLKPLTQEDRQGLMDLFLPVPEEERDYMRHNVGDPQVLSEWIENIRYDEIYPIVAVVEHRLVGLATLHFNIGPARHRGEIRVFLSKDFRRRGLGTRLIQALIDQAKRKNLFLLEVQVVTDRVNDIKAMQKAGFKIACTFEDYFMLPDGELRDVVHLMLRLRATEDEY